MIKQLTDVLKSACILLNDNINIHRDLVIYSVVRGEFIKSIHGQDIMIKPVGNIRGWDRK